MTRSLQDGIKWTANVDCMIGRTLDHYRIESKLGEGGMGIVYDARDMHLDRPVAIKVLPPDKVTDSGRKQRFAHEARTASALNHPNIVTIYDIRSQDGIDFIVMERIDGRTLHELLARKGLRPAEALKYAVQIAHALARAHAAGILHRDLKPSNVMVTEDGLVKVLDFGLAKLLEPADSSADASTLTAHTMTEEGAVLGTTAYMSPEQAEGRKLDARSDIFSFGSMFYEMLTGRRPFKGDSTLSILSKIVSEDPTPPSQISAAISPELEKVILRCLRKDPARRYQTMADLKVALEDLREESAAGNGVQRVRFPQAWMWAAVVPVLLVAVGFLAWRASRSQGSEPLRAEPLTTLPGIESYPSFSPDGNQVAFTWNGPNQDNQDIYVQQIGSGSPLQLTTDPRNDYSSVWSPNGRYIAFLRGESGKSELRLVPPLRGPERMLAEVRVPGTDIWPPYLAWCPNSDCLVITDSPGEGKPPALFVISLESGEKRQLTDPKPPASGDTNPALSPDGSWLVFRRNGSGPFLGELYGVQLGAGLTTAGEPSRLTPASLDAGNPTWMPDSKEILFSVRSGNEGLWRLTVSGQNTPTRLPFVGEDGRMPVVSRPQTGRPSRLVYVRVYRDFNVWRVDTAPSGAMASRPAVSISSTKQDADAQFSPDGRRVAFFSDRSGIAEIWLADADGANAAKLTSMGRAHGAGAPRWSPDGTLIAFHGISDNQGDVFVIPASGGKPRNLTSNPASDGYPGFSRDGKWIYFTSRRTGMYRIWKVPTSGGEAIPVTTGVGYSAVESPDGAYLYYVESMQRPSPLLRMPLPGGSPVKVVDGVVLANFVVLERGVYYIDRPSGHGDGLFHFDKPLGETRLQYFDFATGKSTTVVSNTGDVVGPFLTASRDGRTILYTRLDTSIDDLMLVENFR